MEHPMHHSPCHIVFINYNKTHKSRLKCENKYDLYRIAPKNILKLWNLDFCGFWGLIAICILWAMIIAGVICTIQVFFVKRRSEEATSVSVNGDIVTLDPWMDPLAKVTLCITQNDIISLFIDYTVSIEVRTLNIHYNSCNELLYITTIFCILRFPLICY